LRKYLLFQVPGWLIASIALIAAVHWEWITPPLAVAAFALWVLKDLLFYPLLRRAYEPDRTGAERLVGERGSAEGDLTPRGYVRVRGELWRAVTDSAEQPIASGTDVEVIRAERMELTVRPAARSGNQ
jgi:membrane protein implicated in regulation of membrane protease activity